MNGLQLIRENNSITYHIIFGIMEKNRIIIVGGGFAGLAAGIYGQKNGYSTEIFEMHDKPGGLCTSWDRKGFTIDACIHWLVGSNPQSSFHDIWEEVGLLPGREFVDMELYMRYEASDGRVVNFWTDIDRLEKHLLDISPADAGPIREFINGIRMVLVFDMSGKEAPLGQRLREKAALGWAMATKGALMKKWMNTTIVDFIDRLKEPLLKEAFREIWIPEFSLFFMLFTFAWLHKRNAGYPMGGSMPLSKALEKKYLHLGGQIHYKSKVEKILTENGNVLGVVLADGSEQRAYRVISAADGYTTIFKMLEGKFTSPALLEQYENWPLFLSLLFVGLGVNRTFEEVPLTVSGFSFPLKEPVEIAGVTLSRLPVHLYHHDPSLAPPGKTALTVMLESDYGFWKKLSENRQAYLAAKEEAFEKVIACLEQRFPGITAQVEMSDVATPTTFERYTGNWKGSFEGWLITPQNAMTMVKPMKQTLPGLNHFYMCGQWVEPGGGLPTGIHSGRRLIKSICKEDKKKFTVSDD